MVDETITVGSIEEPVEDSEEEISDEENDENEIDNELDIDDGTSCRSVAAVDVEDLGMTGFGLVSSGTGNFLCASLCTFPTGLPDGEIMFENPLERPDRVDI